MSPAYGRQAVSNCDCRSYRRRSGGDHGLARFPYDKVKDHAHRDASTGLYGRRYTMDRLSVILQRANRDGKPFTVLMIDANNRKWVNDTYGHLAGDEGIPQLACVLRTCTGSEAVIGCLGSR